MKRIPVFYPLEWPANKPRTIDRQWGNYSKGSDRHRREITLAEALTRVYVALDKFNNQGKGVVVELSNSDVCELRTMMQVKKDGTGFYANQRKPPDVGAVLYFEIDNKPLTIAIDKYTNIAQNIAACAAAVDSLRQLWRVDAGTFLAAASGLAGLPPPIAMANWRGILGYPQDVTPTYDEARKRYKNMASAAHPDKGGNENTMTALNRAIADAKLELS